MPFQVVDGIKVFGEQRDALSQMKRIMEDDAAVDGVLCADNHIGYSMPIGGVAAYDQHVSPSGVGYDIACGIKAIRLNVKRKDLEDQRSWLATTISRHISFGVGRRNNTQVDHELFDSYAWKSPLIAPLKEMARQQLGTVGSGNHFVDVLYDVENDDIWIMCHFGSRGLGHKIASGFLNLANGRNFNDRAPGESMDQRATLIPTDTDLGRHYLMAMELAGQYAYAGRDWVVEAVRQMIGVKQTYEVHNHHNYAWLEKHHGRDLWVVRKGATPLNKEGAIGGSCTDMAVIVEKKDSQEAIESLESAPHGAGRVMSRTAATGKLKRLLDDRGEPVVKNGRIVKVRQGGAIDPKEFRSYLKEQDVLMIGGGVDESPWVYRPLKDVMEQHSDSVHIKHQLKPWIVVMAGADEYDPYKD